MNPTVLWVLLGEGLKAAQILLDHGTPDAISRAAGLLGTLLEGHSGAILPEDLAQAIEDMRAGIAANDTEADAALREKFKA